MQGEYASRLESLQAQTAEEAEANQAEADAEVEKMVQQMAQLRVDSEHSLKEVEEREQVRVCLEQVMIDVQIEHENTKLAEETAARFKKQEEEQEARVKKAEEEAAAVIAKLEKELGEKVKDTENAGEKKVLATVEKQRANTDEAKEDRTERISAIIDTIDLFKSVPAPKRKVLCKTMEMVQFPAGAALKRRCHPANALQNPPLTSDLHPSCLQR